MDSINNMNAGILEELQYQALSELEEIINSCSDLNILIERISDWKDKYNIIDIDSFFIDEDLYIRAKNLLNSAFEKMRKEKEEAERFLNTVSQKRTFLRLYTICSNAKNYKDFEDSKGKLNTWLKDHPQSTWNSFDEVYKSYFEKFANENYLLFITGQSEQEKIVSTLEEIVDYSIQYSNYIFLIENVQTWDSLYSNRDNFLNQENKNKINNLLSDAYEKLTPTNLISEDSSDFDSLFGAIAYSSAVFTIASSSNKLANIVDWISSNMPILNTLSEKDSKKIAELLMKEFKINSIPEYFDFSVENVKDDTDILNVRDKALKFFIYKLHAHELTANDNELFETISIKSDLASFINSSQVLEIEPIVDSIDVADNGNVENIIDNINSENQPIEEVDKGNIETTVDDTNQEPMENALENSSGISVSSIDDAEKEPSENSVEELLKDSEEASTEEAKEESNSTLEPTQEQTPNLEHSLEVEPIIPIIDSMDTVDNENVEIPIDDINLENQPIEEVGNENIEITVGDTNQAPVEDTLENPSEISVSSFDDAEKEPSENSVEELLKDSEEASTERTEDESNSTLEPTQEQTQNLEHSLEVEPIIPIIDSMDTVDNENVEIPVDDINSENQPIEEVDKENIEITVDDANSEDQSIEETDKENIEITVDDTNQKPMENTLENSSEIPVSSLDDAEKEPSENSVEELIKDSEEASTEGTEEESNSTLEPTQEQPQNLEHSLEVEPIIPIIDSMDVADNENVEISVDNINLEDQSIEEVDKENIEITVDDIKQEPVEDTLETSSEISVNSFDDIEQEPSKSSEDVINQETDENIIDESTDKNKEETSAHGAFSKIVAWFKRPHVEDSIGIYAKDNLQKDLSEKDTEKNKND